MEHSPMTILLGGLILFAICYAAAWRRARIFNARDKARNYRTTQQRIARW
jgi:hypothetical protein